jgi:LDH2 family malate/lactate/ureidoglycolate dehydrogenase
MGQAVKAEALERFGIALLEAVGTPSAYAREVAANLVFGNLRGVDSHGIRLLLYYLEHIRHGLIQPAVGGEALTEFGAICVYDAAFGLGAATSAECCAIANRLASTHGAGVVTARRANHFGAAAYWARKMADAGHIGIAFCNASTIVAPWQSKEPKFGTNPICMAVPGPYEDSFLLDMATTTVAANRIFKAFQNHEPEIPIGWAMDRDGRPTTDTKAAYEGLVAPLGGYKGTGLALMVEILTSVLAGGAMGSEIGGIRYTEKPLSVSHFFLAIDVKRFMAAEEFAARMRRLLQEIRTATPAAGYDEVLVAGDPEIRVERERRERGIPFSDTDLQALREAAEALGVEPLQLDNA